MSPEQILGKEHIDARTDVYALGCLVYEMLGGEPPLRGNTLQATLARQLSELPAPLRILRQTIPDAVDLAVAGALAKLPADRFSSVADFANALFAAVDGGTGLRLSTPTMRTPARAVPAAAPARGRRGWWLAGGAAAALAVVMLLTQTAPPTPAAPAEAPNVPIAVRAVVNMTGEPAHDATAELLTADLIDQLHRVPQLHVKDRSSSVALGALQLTTRQFADCLAVAFVIEPYLQRDGEAMMLKAHLADGAGNILRPAVIERRGRELLRSGSRDSAAVALIAQLLPGLPRPVHIAETRSPEQSPARDLLLRGNKELAKRSYVGLRSALALFDSAVTIDPE